MYDRMVYNLRLQTYEYKAIIKKKDTVIWTVAAIAATSIGFSIYKLAK
jgi:hypothetical protein